MSKTIKDIRPTLDLPKETNESNTGGECCPFSFKRCTVPKRIPAIIKLSQ